MWTFRVILVKNMYFVPEIYGGHNYDHRADQGDIQICQELYGSPK
jgi:hypothetical protein